MRRQRDTEESEADRDTEESEADRDTEERRVPRSSSRWAARRIRKECRPLCSP